MVESRRYDTGFIATPKTFTDYRISPPIHPNCRKLFVKKLSAFYEILSRIEFLDYFGRCLLTGRFPMRERQVILARGDVESNLWKLPSNSIIYILYSTTQLPLYSSTKMYSNCTHLFTYFIKNRRRKNRKYNEKMPDMEKKNTMDWEQKQTFT